MLKKASLYITSVILLIIYFSIKYAVPYWSKPTLENIISEQVKNKVEIGKIYFNPLRLSFTINDITLGEDDAFVKNLYINFSFPNLITKSVVISEISIDGLRGDIFESNDSLVLKGDNSVKDGAKNSAWKVVAKEINIANSNILFLQKYKIELNKIAIENLSFYDSADVANIDLAFKINDSSISIAGNLSHLLFNPQGKVKILLNDFELAILDSFLKPNIKKISGIASLKASLKIDRDEITVESNLDLRDLLVYNKDLKMVDYFAKEILIENFQLLFSPTKINSEVSLISTKNLMFSVPVSYLKKHKLSQFSKLKVENIKFSKITNGDKFEMELDLMMNNNSKISVKESYGGAEGSFVAHVEDLDLVPLSESFEAPLKYQIVSGKASLDVKTKSIKGKIKGETIVNISHLELDDENEKGESIDEFSMVPLKSAIYMIKDDNGNIKMEFKISENDDGVSFGFFKMLSKGAGSAIVSKFSYMIASELSVKLLPLLVSAIPVSPENAILLTKQTYKMITKPRFKDVEFVVLKSKITPKSEKDLEKFVKFLKENKKVNFRVCPVASTFEAPKDSDKKISAEDALKLAQDRIEVLQEYFKDHMDSLGQVVFCRPKISDDNLDSGVAVVSF